MHNLKSLLPKKFQKMNMTNVALASQICFFFDTYIKNNFPNLRARAHKYMDSALYFSADSGSEGTEIMLHSHEILLYIRSNLPSVKEINLQIVSPRE